MLASRRGFVGLSLAGAVAFLLGGCAGQTSEQAVGLDDSDASGDTGEQMGASVGAGDDVVEGTFERGAQTDRGFEVDDVLTGTSVGDIHFSLHVPDSYDGSRPYALYVHCPAWEGLWFQGVGANLVEDFVFVANDYVEDMVVVSPQLDDWGDTSAEKVVTLTRWMLSNYNIDASRVWLSGYSGGGETVSLVMDKAPGLYRRVLHMSSKWDGAGDALVAAEVPLRMTIGESDDYYRSDPDRASYQELHDMYAAAGLTDDQIGQLLVLDVKPSAYFAGQSDQHGGGAALFPHDAEIMGWLFS